jgi:NitT/TauT family transport system substrate-binding protein
MHSRKQRLAAATAVYLAALVIVGSFSACTRSDQPSANAPERVTIAYSASPDAALAQVAQRQGYYLQEGLDVMPQKHAYGKVALDAVLEGRADFATVAETPVMFAIMNGQQIAVIATIQMSNRNNVIIARKDRGIHAPQDLKGRKIAVTSGTLLDFFLDSFLATTGMTRKAVTVVNVKPEEMINAVVQGNVDAISAWSYVVIEAQHRLGDKGITFLDEEIYTQTFNVIATEEFIRKNPAKVDKLLRALVKAEGFVRKNPAEAQAIVADFCGIEKAVIKEMWAIEDFSVTLDQSLVLALEDEAAWAIKNGFIEKVTIPNFLNYIYVDGLKSVNPKAVRILR